MEEHIRALLQRFQYSEHFKETAAFRLVFGGEESSQVMADLVTRRQQELRPAAVVAIGRVYDHPPNTPARVAEHNVNRA